MYNEDYNSTTFTDSPFTKGIHKNHQEDLVILGYKIINLHAKQ